MILNKTLSLTDKDVIALCQDIPKDKKIHTMMAEINADNNIDLSQHIEPWMYRK